MDISPHDLSELIKQHEAVPVPRYHIFDVRERHEVQASGRLQHAKNVPIALFQPTRHLPENKDALLIFNCALGKRGMRAATAAKEAGYTNVYNLAGGLQAWIAAGLPVVSASSLPEASVACFFDAATFTCQYVVTCDETRETVILDPVLNYNLETARISFEAIRSLVDFVKTHNLIVRKIIETHVHADHLTGSHFLVEELKKQGAAPADSMIPVCIGEGVKKVQAHFGELLSFDDVMDNQGAYFDHLFKDGEEWTLGKLPCRVMHTPGHTPDSTSHLIGNAVFTGDSIFMPDFGSARCDFPNGSAEELYDSVSGKIFSLPPDVITFVGHDYMPNGRPLAFHATVHNQKSSNVHFKTSHSKDEFVSLRKKRDATMTNPRLLFPSLQFNLRAGRLPPPDEKTGNVFIKIPISIAQ